MYDSALCLQLCMHSEVTMMHAFWAIFLWEESQCVKMGASALHFEPRANGLSNLQKYESVQVRGKN